MKDGGPLYPVQDASKYQCHGMSIRDKFAETAMKEYIRHGFSMISDCQSKASLARMMRMIEPSFVSKGAYEHADAMIAEREKEKS